MRRPNLLRQRLAGPRPLIGAYLNFPSPELVEFLGYAGFDWVFLDAEHGGIGLEACYALVRAADAAGLASMVRVPSNDPATILVYAETGVHGLMAPHVASVADAESLVRSLRYWPHGARGAMTGSRAANYGLTQSGRDYLTSQDDHVMAIALLEDKRAFDDLDAIAGVYGVDAFFIGPGDLAMSMELPAETDHPEVKQTIERATEMLAGGGRAVGTIVGTPEAARAALGLGMRLIVVSVAGLLNGAITDFMKGARATTSAGTAAATVDTGA